MADVIRAGYISAVNYQDGTAQVVYKDRDNSISPYMPVWSNEYNMPDVDTLVYVIHLQNGGKILATDPISVMTMTASIWILSHIPYTLKRLK